MKMSSSKKLLEAFIKEQLSASDAKQLVGNYLWPLRSKNAPKSPSDPRYEEDTPDEERLHNAFLSFIMNHQKSPIAGKALKTIYDLQQTGLYKDVLPKPPKQPVYRGMSVGLSWFQRNFGISYKEFYEKSKSMEKAPETAEIRGFDDWFILDDGSRNITPPGEAVMSWSKSLDAAALFATGMGFTGANYNIPLIFEALPSENMLIDISFIYNLDHENDYISDKIKDRKTEQEVLSLGPVNTNRVFCGIWRFAKEGELQPFRYADAKKYPGRKTVPSLPNRVYATPEETDAEFEKAGYADLPRRK